MSLLPLAATIALCLAFSCLVFFVRDQARRSGRAVARLRPSDGPTGC